jgi:hypothetical protein
MRNRKLTPNAHFFNYLNPTVGIRFFSICCYRLSLNRYIKEIHTIRHPNQ